MKKGKLNIMNVVKAAGGGLGGAFLVDKLDDMEQLADKPEVPPLIVMGVGTAMEMFAPPSLTPVAHGMIGAGASMLYPVLMAKINPDGASNGDTSTINAAQAKERAKKVMQALMKRQSPGMVQQRPGMVQQRPGMVQQRPKTKMMRQTDTQTFTPQVHSNTRFRYSSGADC